MKRAWQHAAADDDDDDDDDASRPRAAPTVGLAAGGGDGDLGLEGRDLARKRLAELKKALAANAARREGSSDPSQFLESEVALDAEVEAFKVVASAPEAYPLLVKQGGVEALLELLDHPNLDIVNAALGTLKEVTDSSVVDDNEAAATTLLVALEKANFLKVLLTAVDRVLVSGSFGSPEDQEEAVYSALVVASNLLENVPPSGEGGEASPDARATREDLLGLLLRNLAPKSVAAQFTALRSVSCELLRTLLETHPELAAGMPAFYVHAEGLPSPVNRHTRRCDYTNPTKSPDFISGLHRLMKTLAAYIKLPPVRAAEEVEFVGNAFGALAAVLADGAARDAFLDAHGVRLLLALAVPKKKKSATAAAGGGAEAAATAAFTKRLQHQLKLGALTGLKYATLGSARGCNELVDAAEVSGLGLVGSYLMLVLKTGGADEQDDLERDVVSVLHELAQYLKGDALVRYVQKFTEAGFAKTDRLLELYRKYVPRIAEARRRAADSRKLADPALRMTEEEEEQDVLSSGGLLVGQLSLLVVHLCVYDRRVHAHVVKQLALERMTLEPMVAEVEIACEESVDPAYGAWLAGLRDGLQRDAAESNPPGAS